MVCAKLHGTYTGATVNSIPISPPPPDWQNDAPKYGSADVSAKVLAILTSGGFAAGSQEAEGGLVGLVLDTTSFYAESGGQVGEQQQEAARGQGWGQGAGEEGGG